MTETQKGIKDFNLIKSLTELIPDGKSGSVEINTFTVNDEEVKRVRMNSIMSYTYGEYYDFKAGTYKRLIMNGEIMMSNTQMEIRTNWPFISNANGNVLIAGLGLGMVLLPILNRDSVKKVVVIEKDEDVIKLVEPHIKSDKLEIVKGDIFEFETNEKWDTIYFDIWVSTSADNWEEMKQLLRKFKYKLNRENTEAWMSCWRKEKCQKDAAEERADERNYSRMMW